MATHFFLISFHKNGLYLHFSVLLIPNENPQQGLLQTAQLYSRNIWD